MGNNGDRRKSIHKDSQQVGNSRHSRMNNDELRSTTSQRLDTDRRETYERSPGRASSRARSERTSYSATTGYLDSDETEPLDEDSDDFATNASQYSVSLTSPTGNRNTTSNNNDSDHQNQGSSNPRTAVYKKSKFEQTFLDNLNRALANSPPVATTLQSQQSYEFHNGEEEPKGKNSRKKHTKQMALYNIERGCKVDATGDKRGRFTYTEVPSPLKTSPAFEYILRNNERRNKRYCLLFLYSTLMTICIAIIVFSSVHLMSRFQPSRP